MQERLAKKPLFHQLSGVWVSMDPDSWFPHDSSNHFWINSWFLECLVEVFKANDRKSASENEDDAIVRLPTTDKATFLATMINQKYPATFNKFLGSNHG